MEILSLLIAGQLRLGTLLEAVALLMPFLWVYALPMGLLAATLLVFGRFSARQRKCCRPQFRDRQPRRRWSLAALNAGPAVASAVVPQ